MNGDGWRVRWLFSVIDYQHWEVIYRTMPVAQIVTNAADRSVHVASYQEDTEDVLEELPRTYTRMAQWLRTHET